MPSLPTSPSVSSAEQPTSSRFSTLTRRLSRNGSASSRSSLKQRQSQTQLGDLPTVEMQLLPSLRDTIDKMTNTSRMSAQYDEGYFMTTPRPQDRYITGRRSSLFNLRVQDAPKQTAVHALVFTDLVLLVSSLQDDAWRLIDEIGISRILGITEDRAGGSISLDLLPIDPDDLSTGAIPDSAPVTSVTLTIPHSNSSGTRLEPSTISDIRMKWASAFQQCSQHTLRALSFPFHSGKYLAQGPHANLALDSRQSVMAILASGLPLPKSPSTQLDDTMRGRGGDSVQQEREERGWWALRFQRVLHEMQRGEFTAPSLPRLVLGPSTSTSDIVRKRPGVSRPRPLKLASLSSSESLSLKDTI
ncbi:hypothetical protein OF83DRAFT_1085568 [Amylostereum chailletii]|nr:hypothetical protein OF83DRAFT_1085568 [Amylostereum chailletii]